MTQWDFVMDAPASTISKAWIWHDGGADFGVPLTNYFGWLLTSSISISCSRFTSSAGARYARSDENRALRFAAILFYVCSGLADLTPWLMGQSGEVADATGHVWRIQDLRETAVAVMLFTMFFTSLLAALRLAQERRMTSNRARPSFVRSARRCRSSASRSTRRHRPRCWCASPPSACAAPTTTSCAASGAWRCGRWCWAMRPPASWNKSAPRSAASSRATTWC